MTCAGGFENRRTDAERATVERLQIDAADDDVATQQRGIERRLAQQPGEHIQMFGLQQRDLSLAVRVTGEVIAGEAATGTGFDGFDDHGCDAPRRSNADPADPSHLRQRGEQFGQRHAGSP